MQHITRLLALCVALSSASSFAGLTDAMKKQAEPSPALIATVVQKAHELKSVRQSQDAQRLSAFRSELAELLKGDAAKYVKTFATLNDPSPMTHVTDATSLPVTMASWGGKLSADLSLWFAVGTYVADHFGFMAFDHSLLALAVPGALATVVRLVPLKNSPATARFRDGALRWGGLLLSTVAVGDMIARLSSGDLGWMHGIVDAPSAIGVGVGLASAVPAYLILRYVRKVTAAASETFWATIQLAYAEAYPNLSAERVATDILELKKEVILVAQGKCPEALAVQNAEEPKQD